MRTVEYLSLEVLVHVDDQLFPVNEAVGDTAYRALDY
jgi:hypothetical protein